MPENMEELIKEYLALKELLREKDEIITKLEKLNNWYFEALKLKAAQKFGKSSEVMHDNLTLFNEAEEVKETFPVEPKEDIIPSNIEARTKRKEREESF